MGPGSAPHHFVPRRIRDTRGANGASCPGRGAALWRCTADPGPIIGRSRRHGSRISATSLRAASHPGHAGRERCFLSRTRCSALAVHRRSGTHNWKIRAAWVPDQRHITSCRVASGTRLPDGQISAQFFGMLLHKLPPMSAKSPARKIEIRKSFQSDLPCPVLSAKTFCFSSGSNRWFVALSRPRHEGRIAIVTKREAGCDGRVGARDERGLCERRSRVVLAPLGWRQVGDDALHRADDGD